jgi:putative addiction module component (TIGR02574 family)
VEAAWEDEIKRRVEDIRGGRVKTIPGEQVLGRLKARLRDGRV